MIRLQVPGRLDVELAAGPGDVVAVVGPNGAGKTTLLHALAGVIPARGVADLGSGDLMVRPTHLRRVGMVFQDQRLFPHLTNLENVAFGIRQSRASTDVVAQAWLDRLRVGHLARRRPRELSGGQAQRVAIARALATDPEVLLLDEPFAGLDVGIAAELRIELAAHLRDYGGVTLLVTHDALDALTLATRVAVLDAGSIVQTGEPHEVAARPATEHVARLVGLNILRSGDEIRAFTPSAVSVTLDEPHGSPRHRWHGEVRGVVPHGDAVRLDVATDDGPLLLADVTPAATRDLALSAGTSVWLAVKETAITTYRAADG